VRTTTTTATMAAAMIPRTMSLRSKATVERISSRRRHHERVVGWAATA